MNFNKKKLTRALEKIIAGTKVKKVTALDRSLEKLLQDQSIDWKSVYNNLQLSLYHGRMVFNISGGRFAANERYEGYHLKREKEYNSRLAKALHSNEIPMRKLESSRIGIMLLGTYKTEITKWLDENCIEKNVGKEPINKLELVKPI